jgi:hypothetical protein
MLCESLDDLRLKKPILFRIDYTDAAEANFIKASFAGTVGVAVSVDEAIDDWRVQALERLHRFVKGYVVPPKMQMDWDVARAHIDFALLRHQTERCAICSHERYDHRNVCWGVEGWEDGGACGCPGFEKVP